MTAPNNPTPDHWPLLKQGDHPLNATISRLTAERDILRVNVKKEYDEALMFSKEIDSLQTALSKEFQHGHELTIQLTAAEAANKLISERIAVLESAMEPFVTFEIGPYHHDDSPITGGLYRHLKPLTVKDIRRARDAREGK